MKEKINDNNLKLYIDQNSFRYKHILGVVEEMKDLLKYIDIDKGTKEELIELAYLHDIGYSEKLIKTGYHPLDGALFCRNKGYGSEVVAAVMFHTGAYEDVRRNFPDILEPYLEQKYHLTPKASLYIDFITYCDLRRSSIGTKITFQERMDDISRRYGKDHNVSLTMKASELSFIELIKRVENYKLSQNKIEILIY